MLCIFALNERNKPFFAFKDQCQAKKAKDNLVVYFVVHVQALPLLVLLLILQLQFNPPHDSSSFLSSASQIQTSTSKVRSGPAPSTGC